MITRLAAAAPAAGHVVAARAARDIVHTSVGSSEIRIRISNVSGSKPPAIKDVRVALRR